MISEIPFPHHTYGHESIEGSYEIMSAADACPVEEPQCGDVPDVASDMKSAHVTELILIHGTFAGNDVIGLVREISRYKPQMARTLRNVGKNLFDQVAGDVGNYTDAFAEHLEVLVNESESNAIHINRFNWSGENHHLGRVGGAISLLHYLTSQSWSSDQRVLLWGHSHGGNVIAIASLLLGASSDAIERFFDATRMHYRNPITGRLDLPHWEEVKRNLLSKDLPYQLPALDVATFGTPPRYRWNTNVCTKLLHFVQHRPLDVQHPGRASIPNSVQDVIEARGGDYIQQIGIAGTDFPHQAFAWRSWSAERRLRDIFESTIRLRDLPNNLRSGYRVSLDGKTLLVDYPSTDEHWNQKLIGHGVYTRPEWLPFHLNEISDHFYRSSPKT